MSDLGFSGQSSCCLLQGQEKADRPGCDCNNPGRRKRGSRGGRSAWILGTYQLWNRQDLLEDWMDGVREKESSMSVV